MSFVPAFFSRSATRLSWLEPRRSRRLGRFVGLARLSLGVAIISMLSGCLVDDPPPLVAPKKTKPFLDNSNIHPGVDQLIVTNSGELVMFTIPVKSEDAGDPLFAILLFDYTPDSDMVEPAGSVPMPASTFDDTSRVFTLPVTVRPDIKPGCHRYTLRVTHQSNIVPGHSDRVINKADLAEAFWLANINVPPENAGQLVNCPNGGNK